MEQFHCVLTELAHKCNLGTEQDSIIRDVFITNMQNEKFQQDLLSTPCTPDTALEYAIARDLGLKYQNEITAAAKSSTTPPISIKQEPVGAINQNRSGNSNLCYLCGLERGPQKPCKNRELCPAKNAVCHRCGKTGHFGRCCRSNPQNGPKQQRNPRGTGQRRPNNQNRRVQNVEEDQQEQTSTPAGAPTQHQAASAVIESWYNTSQCNIIASNDAAIPALLLPIKVGNKYESKWMADSGSPRTLIKTKTAHELLTSKAAVETGIPSGIQLTYFN